MINGVLQMLFIPSGLFLILSPAALHASFALSPIATSLALCGFFCSVIPDAINKLSQQQQLKLPKTTTQENKPTLNKKKNDPESNASISDLGIFGHAAKAACTLGAQTARATEHLLFSSRSAGK